MPLILAGRATSKTPIVSVDLESIYARLPVFLQNISCSLEGVRIRRSRYGASFWKIFEDVEKRVGWSNDRIQEFRNNRLQTFVRYAANTVPYYRLKFQEWGVDPLSITSLMDLHRLPVLTKQDVQGRAEEFISDAIPVSSRLLMHTSGTTGGGLRFFSTLDAQQEQWAVWWRYRRWHGISLGTWCGYFGGRSVVPVSQSDPPFWRINLPGRQILFSGYHMSPPTMNSYVAELRKRKPLWLHGYPSLLSLLANHLLEERQTLGYDMKFVTTGAENLLPGQVEAMERAFGVHPRQHYGMAEAVANFSECENGRLHVDEDFAATEFLPIEGSNSYRIVGTNITNFATPLLRYEVGDTVTLSSGSCSCGRPGRIVDSVDGRLEDYVTLRNGARLGRMDHVFKDMVQIREAQLFQERPGEIEIRIVRNKEYSPEDESRLLREFKKRVGEDCQLSVRYLDSLDRTKSGKLRFVVSSIKNGQVR